MTATNIGEFTITICVLYIGNFCHEQRKPYLGLNNHSPVQINLCYNSISTIVLVSFFLPNILRSVCSKIFGFNFTINCIKDNNYFLHMLHLKQSLQDLMPTQRTVSFLCFLHTPPHGTKSQFQYSASSSWQPYFPMEFQFL